MTSDIYIFSELKPIERYKLLCGSWCRDPSRL